MDDLLHWAYIVLMIAVVAFIGMLMGKWVFIVVGAVLAWCLLLRVLRVLIEQHMESAGKRRVQKMLDESRLP